MEVLKSLFDIFRGKNNLIMHVAIFSLTGIQALCLNAYVSHNLGSFYSSYLGYAPNDELTLSLMSVLGIMVTIFLFGYGLKYSNKIYNDKTVDLPDISLDVFPMILKYLPMVLIWGTYFYIATSLGFRVLSANGFLFYFYYILLMMFVPFVFMIFVKFSKDFCYSKEMFLPSVVTSYMDKYARAVWGIIAKILLVFFIGFTVVCLIFYNSDRLTDASATLSVRLFGLSLMFYLFNISYMMYVNGVAKILQNECED